MKSRVKWFSVGGCVALLLTLLVAVPVLANPTLPPRPSVPVILTGGTIKLTVDGTQVIADGTHTVVQWQDGITGEWEDVEGWQATFDHTRKIVWWVAPEHMGQGNYRWLVFDSDDNQLAMTETFNLPSSSWEPLILWASWE